MLVLVIEHRDSKSERLVVSPRCFGAIAWKSEKGTCLDVS
jgi:hypothetical protein